MKQGAWIRLVGLEVFLLAMGSFLGRVTQAGKEGWYETLVRSSLTPPDWVFGVVWTILYLMIGYVAWILWEKRAFWRQKRAFFALFGLQMVLNWAWTPLFFTVHALMLSFVWILALVVVVAALVFLLAREDRRTAFWLVPYLAWSAFAAYLSGFIAFVN